MTSKRSCLLRRAGFAVLLDDCVDRKHFGVKRLVDSELVEVFQPELIRTEWNSAQQDFAGAAAMGMVLIESTKVRTETSARLAPETVRARLAASRRRSRLLGARDRASSLLRRFIRTIPGS